MACNKKHDNHKCNENEVLVNGIVFNYSLNEVSENSFDLVATPCNVPTSVFCIARITTRQNCCNNLEYYQSFINADPVQIIQDCNLDDIIARSIEAYFSNNLGNMGCCSNNNYGAFGLF